MVDAHVSGACAARRAGSIPVLGTIPIEDSAGGVIHFTPPVFCLCRLGVAIIWAHSTNLGKPGSPDKPGGEIPQTKRKVIHLHHEHTRTFSIGAVDSAIRDTFKL